MLSACLFIVSILVIAVLVWGWTGVMEFIKEMYIQKGFVIFLGIIMVILSFAGVMK
jgi:hypothetical protein